MKDFSKLFETVMEFKGLSFIVTEKFLIKKQCPVFFFATVSCNSCNSRSREQQKTAQTLIAPYANKSLHNIATEYS